MAFMSPSQPAAVALPQQSDNVANPPMFGSPQASPQGQKPQRKSMVPSPIGAGLTQSAGQGKTLLGQ